MTVITRINPVNNSKLKPMKTLPNTDPFKNDLLKKVTTMLRNLDHLCERYRVLEEYITNVAYKKFWRKQYSGNLGLPTNVEKIKLLLKAMIRLAFFAVFFVATAAVTKHSDDPWFPLGGLGALGSMFLVSYLILWTGSQRLGAITLFAILMGLTFMANLLFGGAITLAIRSHSLLYFVGLFFGTNGLIGGTASLLVMNHLFYRMEMSGVNFFPANMTQEEKITVIYQTSQLNTMLEFMIIIVSQWQMQEAIGLLEKANKHKSDFLCRMSHELRTPLSGIIGAADIMAFAPLADEYKKLVEITQACSKNLLQVINDILDFSKLEAEKMILTKSTVNIRKVIKTSMEVISPLITPKKDLVSCETKFSNDVPELILADELRLKQVLLNLLSNSVKFTQRGTISVNCSITRADEFSKTMNKERMFITPANNDKNYLKLEIEDSGRGISPDEIELIFSAFEQSSDTRKSTIGGTGLGLNICLMLCKLMEGAIDVKSYGVNKGCKFTVCVPFEEVSANRRMSVSSEQLLLELESPRTQLKKIASTGEAKLKRPFDILLAEDNAVNQVIFKGIFKKLGLEVDIVDNGQLAVERIKSGNAYDIIFLDLEMPIQGGIETARQMRELNIKTPILALTAHTLDEKKNQAINAGMNDFVRKPCSLSQLRSVLMKYIKLEEVVENTGLVSDSTSMVDAKKEL